MIGRHILASRLLVAMHQLKNLLEGDIDFVGWGKKVDCHSHRIIFPGAFNPLHKGHLAMARIAEARLGLTVDFEISAFNVDKPALMIQDILSRVRQFSDSDTVWITQAATFLEKSKLFPNATFLVGADTVARLLDPAYYENVDHCIQSLETITKRGCRFLAFGRERDGIFQVELTRSEWCNNLNLQSLFEWIPENQFRVDISSSQIRANNDHMERE